MVPCPQGPLFEQMQLPSICEMLTCCRSKSESSQQVAPLHVETMDIAPMGRLVVVS
jgi:hypothetical protein